MSRLLLRSLRSPQAVVAFAVASSVSAVSCSPPTRLEAAQFDKPTFTERTVGSYENRLRKFSSPERVFEYFSSVELDKEYYMTRDDLARAVTPYTYRHGAPIASKNPKFNAKASSDKIPKDVADEYLRRVQKLLIDNSSVSKKDVEELLAFREEQHVDFETHIKTLKTLQVTNAEFDQFVVMHGGPRRPKTFFDMVDADGMDSSITQSTYKLTFCVVPERQFELAFKMFDTDDNGELDHREFKQIMELMRLRTPAGRQDRSLHDEDVPIFKHLFGELATKSLSYDEFCAFRRELKQEIMRIQISFTPTQYDVDGDRTLSPREFGMFLVSHVDQRHIEQWVERVDKLQHLSGHITEQEFMDFNVFLEHLDELKVAMDLVMQAHGVNKEQFQRATRAAVRASKNTKPVTPLQIDILFALFDLDGDGHLSTKEFIEVMQTRKDSGFTEVPLTSSSASRSASSAFCEKTEWVVTSFRRIGTAKCATSQVC
ncbi:EF-Hand 1, calcium-binding site [Phytophthora cactorum]|nr:EF-Hand 1, calcium-binding site [Phytophthora cactorum]